MCQQLFNLLPEINATVETKVRVIGLFGARIYHCKYGPVTAQFDNKEFGECGVKAFVCMGEADSEDTKDASRSTGNLWDLEEFKKTYEAAGIEVQTDKFEGGHEMPTTKHGSSRALFKRFYEFIIRNDGKPFPSEVF